MVFGLLPCGSVRSGTNESLREATGSGLSELPDGLAHLVLQFNGPIPTGDRFSTFQFHFTRKQSHRGETLFASLLASGSPSSPPPIGNIFQKFGRLPRKLRATQPSHIPNFPPAPPQSTASGEIHLSPIQPVLATSAASATGSDAQSISRLRHRLGA